MVSRIADVCFRHNNLVGVGWTGLHPTPRRHTARAITPWDTISKRCNVRTSRDPKDMQQARGIFLNPYGRVSLLLIQTLGYTFKAITSSIFLLYISQHFLPELTYHNAHS